MAGSPTNQYADKFVAEFYDQWETQTDDIDLIRRLAAPLGKLRILEPFCGTGRILLPLAADGHEITGVDSSHAMLERARAKIRALGADVRERVTLIEEDVTAFVWPVGFDLVILGGNCFYELPSADAQEACIASAAAALVRGGYVYVDNNHMEGGLEETWCRKEERKTLFPAGTFADGTRLEGTTQTLWFDSPRRLVRARRTITVTRPDGARIVYEFLQEKHPVSFAEVKNWLEKHGFTIEATFGSRQGEPYSETADRAIFWATTKTRS